LPIPPLAAKRVHRASSGPSIRDQAGSWAGNGLVVERETVVEKKFRASEDGRAFLTQAVRASALGVWDAEEARGLESPPT
jgi:hypothetical protein